MNIEDRIQHDIDELKKYRRIVSETFDSEPDWSYLNPIARYHLVVDISGCLEYWLKFLCERQKEKNQLNLSYRDIRGKIVSNGSGDKS